MKNNFITKIIGATLAFAMMIGGAVGINAAKQATEVNAAAASSSASVPTSPTYSHVMSSGDLAVTATGSKTLSGITWSTTCANTSAYLGYDGTKGVQLGSGTSGKTIQSGYTISTSVSSFGQNKKITKTAIGLACASSGGYSGTLPNGDTISSTTTSVLYWTSATMSQTSGDITFSFKSDKQKAVYVKAIYVWYENASDPSLPQYTVTYNTLGGEEEYDAAVVTQGDTILDLPVPTKAKNTSTQTRYEFEGWYTENTFEHRFTSETQVTSDLTLYANYDEIHYNIVTFHTNGGTAVEDQEVDNGQKVTQPNSTKDGYMLEGWYKEEGFVNRFNFNSTITDEDLDLYAKWTSVSIEDNGLFVKVENTAEIVSGGKYLITYNDTVAFNGFLDSLDGTSNTINLTFDGDYIVKDANTCKAYFVIDTENNTIKSASGYYIGRTANSNGLNSSTTQAYENTMSIDGDGHFVATTSSGLLLRYNKSSGQYRFRFFTTGQEAIDLYKFVKTYTVSFDTNGGSNVDPVTVFDGNLLTLPNNPTKAPDANYNYSFVGWYTDEELMNPFVSSTPITEDITLYAKYSAEEIDNPDAYLGSATSVASLSARESYEYSSPKTISKTVAQVSGTPANGTQVAELVLNSSITVSVNANGNNGKVYADGAEWRVYQGDNAQVNVTAANNGKISSITFEFTVEKNGVFQYGDNPVTSGEAVEINDLSSAIFTVGNSTEATNGQVKITAISVTYSENEVTVDNVSMKLGLTIPAEQWEQIAAKWTISNYGIMLFRTTEERLSSVSTVEEYFTADPANVTIVDNGDGTAPDPDGDEYRFSVVINFRTTAAFARIYCAAPFIVVDGTYYFLDEMRVSVNSLASDYLANGGSNLSTQALTYLSTTH